MPASIAFSRGQFWALLGSVLGGLLLTITVLIGVVYRGLIDGNLQRAPWILR